MSHHVLSHVCRHLLIRDDISTVVAYRSCVMLLCAQFVLLLKSNAGQLARGLGPVRVRHVRDRRHAARARSLLWRHDVCVRRIEYSEFSALVYDRSASIESVDEHARSDLVGLWNLLQNLETCPYMLFISEKSRVTHGRVSSHQFCNAVLLDDGASWSTVVEEGEPVDTAGSGAATWFKPIPESERPATPEPEWTIPPNDFPEPEHNWANAYATTFKVPEENKLQRKTYDIGSFIKWFCRRTGKKKLCKADLEGPAFNLVKAFHKNSVFLQYQMDECHKLLTNKVDLSNPEGHQILRNIYEPLPLGGPPGQVTIQPQFFFNKDLDYLLTGDKERKIALSISKLKAARYLDFGLEELVPSLWVESEREYDISAVYGITHWWFRRKEFYINKHSESSDREAVRSQMRILSVISVKVFEKYGYNYLREIILRRADYQEYKISEKDFKNLHPNDFEDLFLLNIQEKLNHLPKTDKTSLHTAVNMWIRNLVIRNRVGDLQLGIESYQTKINLERPNWDAADYYFKEDYTIVPKPRAVVYRDRNNQRKLMRLNELHKFSDGTLTRVMEKLDQMVKDFHLYEYNKGMETRKWSEDDKRRSKDFITAIEKRLQIRRIYRSLESFVGGRIRDIDYRLINRTT
ncbi:hypothetical protein Tco_1110782 [Tanacetum coccineum]|uniref:Uncharacterized protein n=1 Tax=Tanacetum coccineum TaxID=301880 RepID=A0ABQ5IJS7_9ASTR